MYSPVWNPLLFAILLGLLVLKRAQCFVALAQGPADFMVLGRARCVVAQAKGPENFVAPGWARCGVVLKPGGSEVPEALCIGVL